MEDVGTHNYSVDDIMRIVRQEAKKQTFGNSVFQKKKSYTYDDFLQYDFDDEIFIKNVYIGLLEREADPVGLNIHLDLLQSGKKTKIEIITLLRDSGEGHVANVDLAPPPFEMKDSYTYDDFLQYDDVEFIKNAYLGLLKREVDINGLNNHLSLLHSGKISKRDIIDALLTSEEGLTVKVMVQ